MIPQGYKQTEIGVIPEDWKIQYLSDFGDVISGGTPSTTVSEYWDGDVAWCTPSDITSTDGKYIFKTVRCITEKGLKNSAATVLPTNSILLCTRATIGELKLSGAPMATNQGFKNLHSNGSGNIDYLYYLLQTKKKDMVELAIGSTFLEISKKALCSIALQTPSSLDEQKRIAEALSDVDSMISSLEKLIAKKKAVKQGAMQELLTGKKRIKGFFGEWQIKKLEEYCSLITKQTGFDYSAYIKPALTKRKSNNTLPMIQTINFRGKRFDFNTDYYIPKSVAENFPNIILKNKCVLFSIVGASVGNIGLYPGGVSFCGGAIGITRFYEEDDADWVYYYMSSSEGQAQIQYVTKGGAQATVTIADIRNFSIPTPSKEERIAITVLLSDMDNEIEALEQKLEKTRQIKQGMMQQLLTGKIRLV